MDRTVIVRHCTVAEIEHAPNIDALFAEYADESSIIGLPHPAAQMEMYATLETAGALYSYGAFQGPLLIGFVTVLSHIMPHYGASASTTESFFVAKSYRKTGAGSKLLRAAELHAKNRGSAGILISTPFGGRLAEVLPKAGYRQTNAVFFKRLTHE